MGRIGAFLNFRAFPLLGHIFPNATTSMSLTVPPGLIKLQVRMHATAVQYMMWFQRFLKAADALQAKNLAVAYHCALSVCMHDLCVIVVVARRPPLRRHRSHEGAGGR